MGGKFFKETHHLRLGGQKLLLLVDYHISHAQFSSLNLLKSDVVTVCDLPIYTSHITQPLDLSVFSSFKENFRKALRERELALIPLKAETTSLQSAN